MLKIILIHYIYIVFHIKNGHHSNQQRLDVNTCSFVVPVGLAALCTALAAAARHWHDDRDCKNDRSSQRNQQERSDIWNAAKLVHLAVEKRLWTAVTIGEVANIDHELH